MGDASPLPPRLLPSQISTGAGMPRLRNRRPVPPELHSKAHVDRTPSQTLIIARKPQGFFHSAVKHLFIDHAPKTVPVSTVNTILAACLRVESLFVHNQVPAVSVLPGLECLRRLAIPVEVLCGPTAIDFTAPFLRNISHLDVRGDARNHSNVRLLWNGLSCMPHLTHVAFDPGTIEYLTPGMMIQNTRLRCIVYGHCGDLIESEEDPIENLRPLSADIRFVCITQWVDYKLEWLRGADLASGKNIWALAEAFIAAKAAGKIDRSCYSFTDTYLPLAMRT
ncbi:hypothetical protein K438DRAFT_2111412 [Mycena galopus ATCC 62051]|nr:hypothetical protein K438DRAFT_2111412 [Mycena galopus ATCC 62051]